MSSRGARIAAFAALWLAAPPAAGQLRPLGVADGGALESGPGEVFDRLVAIVEGEVLTQSALEFEARVALILAAGERAADAPLDEEALGAALDLSIGERLQVREAERLQTFQLDPAEIDGAVDRFRARFSSAGAVESFLDGQGVDSQTLLSVLARKLRAERLLDSRVRLRAQVPEAEVRAYFDEHRAELSQEFPVARTSIREKLYRERYKLLVRQELDKLRAAASVRLVAPFARVAR